MRSTRTPEKQTYLKRWIGREKEGVNMIKEGDVSEYKGRKGIVYKWDNAPNISMTSIRLVWWNEEYICVKEGE